MTPELPAHILSMGSALECICSQLEYANDLRTIELLQGSDNTGDQAAVVAAKKVIWQRIQQRAAVKLKPETEKGGEEA